MILRNRHRTFQELGSDRDCFTGSELGRSGPPSLLDFALLVMWNCHLVTACWKP